MLLGLAILGEVGTAVPHAWRPPLAGACVLWLCRPIRCSRKLRAHFFVGSRFFTDSCAHDQQRQRTVLRTVQTVETNRRSLSHDKRQTTIGSYPFQCMRIGREQHVPDSIACGTSTMCSICARPPVLSPVRALRRSGAQCTPVTVMIKYTMPHLSP